MDFPPFVAQVRGTPTWITQTALLFGLLKMPQFKGDIRGILMDWFAPRRLERQTPLALHNVTADETTRTPSRSSCTPSSFWKRRLQRGACSVAKSRRSERIYPISLGPRKAGQLKIPIGIPHLPIASKTEESNDSE